jgi:aspartate/methionine/tyrosine aminotransferase
VTAAAQAFLATGLTPYTQATGLPELRAAIARWYAAREGLQIDPRRIVVTAGASAALQLICTALVDHGDEMLMPDPSYPCNRHFVTAVGGVPRILPTGPAQRFQLDAAQVAAAWQPRTRGVLLASPSNPTGTRIAPDTLRAVIEAVRERGGVTIVDEIYAALGAGTSAGESAEAGAGAGDDAVDAPSALHCGDDVIVINSFSKYWGMTGWRLGWLVVPEALVAPIEKLAQNLYICPSTIAQHAALACFQPDTLALCEARRRTLRARRDFIVPALNSLGLSVPVAPDGAFYAWFDVSAYSASSWDFCFDMMHRAQIALTPGRDFGHDSTQRYARLSYASSMDDLQEAVRRLRSVLGRDSQAPRPV